MPADTSKRDRVAILIGEQVDQNTANDFVVNATDGIPTVSSAGGATSVLVEPSAVSFGFSRVAQDPSNYGSTYYQKPGSFQHLDPSLSFTVPLRGGLFTTTPDLDISRALLLSGCGVGSGASNVVPDASDPSLFTQYNLAPTGVTYSTIKLWRGDECWVFVGCFMNITMNFTANEYGTLACEVFSGASTFYSAGNTVSTLPWAEYPTNIGYQEYTENPDHVEDIYPSLNLAAMSIGGIDRPLTSGSISVSNTTSSIPDSNAPEGVIISPEGRSVEFSGTFLENNSTNASNEFDYLITNRGGLSVSAFDFFWAR